MVFCEGAKAIENPFFKELKFKNAMGHMVKFESNHLPQCHIKSWEVGMPNVTWVLYLWCKYVLAVKCR